MAEQTKIKLTQSKLDLYGVQVTVSVHIGDWSNYVAISPTDYKVFKKWTKIYSDHVIDSIVKSIEQDLQDKK